ncbi:uncharacterized protein [Hemitrygon akajei]|uniref:uncharacterized protein n=1 Tax=Hemitrygon akajei TaxID=2704970 RepID=UPI003BF9CADF
MHANEMKIVIFIIAAVQIFYCSAQTCGVMAPPQAELALNATITKVNVEYAVSNIFAVQMCEVVQFILLTNGFALLDITISVQETECAKNSTLDLAQCPLKPISDAETANCTGRVLTEEDRVRSIITKCTNTTAANALNLSTATPTTGFALNTASTSPNPSTTTPTTGFALNTTGTSPNPSTATPTTGFALNTTGTSPNATTVTPVTRETSTVNATLTTKMMTTTTTTRNRSSSSSESSESSERCSRRFGWRRYWFCRRRNGWRRGNRRRWRPGYRRWQNIRQLNLSQIIPYRSAYATTTPYKAEENGE